MRKGEKKGKRRPAEEGKTERLARRKGMSSVPGGTSQLERGHASTPGEERRGLGMGAETGGRGVTRSEGGVGGGQVKAVGSDCKSRKEGGDSGVRADGRTD